MPEIANITARSPELKTLIKLYTTNHDLWYRL